MRPPAQRDYGGMWNEGRYREERRSQRSREGQEFLSVPLSFLILIVSPDPPQ